MAKPRRSKKKNMEIANSNHNGTAGDKKLVVANGSGEGLPYAPVDWPEPGDIWSWKVGNRVSLDGHFVDRYLYLPIRLQTTYNRKRRFASKCSIEEFIAASFPNQDVDEFMSSFSWKIPSAKEKSKTKGVEIPFDSLDSDEMQSDSVEMQSDSDEMQSDSDEMQSDSDDAQSGAQPAARCKAGNKRCSSLVPPSGELEAMICLICCKADSFCRDCCCALCSRTINISANGGLDYIRCESPTGDNFVCGHIFHVDCAIQTFMAGTVGGSIDLDAEYLCNPCNSKTDLIPYVEKLLKASQSNSSMDDVQKSLRMCANLLSGSTRTKAIDLMRFVKRTMGKIKNGMSLEEVWKVELDISPSINVAVAATDGAIVKNIQHRRDEDVLMISRCLKFDELRMYQENENRIAEEKMLAEKSRLVDLKLASTEAEGDHHAIVVAERKRKNLGEEEYEVRRKKVSFKVDIPIDSSKKKSWGDEANEKGGDIGVSATLIPMTPSDKVKEASASQKGISDKGVDEETKMLYG